MGVRSVLLRNGESMKKLQYVKMGATVCAVISLLLPCFAQAQSPETLLTARQYPVGSNPYFCATGDFNGDGIPDLVVANSNSTTISVFLNTATGAFAARADYSTGSTPYGIAVGDFDGDGKPDLVVTNFNASSVSVFPQYRKWNVCGTSEFHSGNQSPRRLKTEFCTSTQCRGNLLRHCVLLPADFEPLTSSSCHAFQSVFPVQAENLSMLSLNQPCKKSVEREGLCVTMKQKGRNNAHSAFGRGDCCRAALGFGIGNGLGTAKMRFGKSTANREWNPMQQRVR